VASNTTFGPDKLTHKCRVFRFESDCRLGTVYPNDLPGRHSRPSFLSVFQIVSSFSIT
jgi:hypothetical protein